jgi:hypothetical protein
MRQCPDEPASNGRNALRISAITLFVSWSVAAPAQDGVSSLNGVWSSTLTTPDHPAWRIEDHLCGFCSPREYRHLQRLLADSANNARSLRELQQESRDAERQRTIDTVTAAGRERLARIERATDESETCDAPNLLVIAVGAPLPIAIEVLNDHVTLRNQHWNVARTIPLSKAAPVAMGDATRYGNSTARFEGAMLIVESVNVLPIATGEAVTTEQAVVLERYTASADESRLDLTVEIRDADTYREPRMFYRPRIRTTEIQLVDDDPCANVEH